MLPLSYATRNLLRTPSRALQLVIGSALVVLLICAAQSFSSGMDKGLVATGNPRNVILLGAGSRESLERSEIHASVAGIVTGSIGGLVEHRGRPAVSAEVLYNTAVEPDGYGPRDSILRGITPAAVAVHSDLRIVEGRFPGPDEIMAGVRAHDVMGLDPEDLAVGSTIRFEGNTYTVSGRFVAAGSVLESELWLDLPDLMAASGRDTLSSVVVQLDTAELGDVELFAAQRLDLELMAVGERTYYRKLAAFFGPIKLMAWITALLIALGAVFGGLNTLYAAFAARIAELGTLQAMGFPRWAIALSLLQESCLATLAGTAVALAVAVFLFADFQFAFSVGVFGLDVTTTTLATGLVAGVVLGVVGCVPPAWRCLAPPVPATLRAV